MPQRPKEKVRRAILQAAAEAWSEQGLARTTLDAIARRAGTSVGNIYKYFPSKQQLFAAAIPADFTTELIRRVQAQVEALGHELDASELVTDHPYRRAAEDLLRYSLQHRARVLFLLRHAEGTVHASFARELVQQLVELAARYAAAAYPGLDLSPALRRALTRIYRAFVVQLAAILEQERGEGAAREALRLLGAYHLSGLRALFASSTAAQPMERKDP